MTILEVGAVGGLGGAAVVSPALVVSDAGYAFIGVVVSALVGAVATVAVALINRNNQQQPQQQATLEATIAALFPDHRPGTSPLQILLEGVQDLRDQLDDLTQPIPPPEPNGDPERTP